MTELKIEIPPLTVFLVVVGLITIVMLCVAAMPDRESVDLAREQVQQLKRIASALEVIAGKRP